MRQDVLKLLADDVGDHDEVKTIVNQALIWPGHYEVRCFCADGKVYTAMFDDEDNQITSFVEAPQAKENK